MKERNYIGELSNILKIPASTLRYWESQSLVDFPRDKENNYRSLSFKTLLSLWDIMFYRDLSIPLKEIKQIPSMNINELENTLTKNKQSLIDELHNLKETIKKIESKEKYINKIKQLRSNPYHTEKCTFHPIKLFNFPEEYLGKEMIQFIFSNWDEYRIVINEEHSIYDFGTFVSESDTNIFREKDKSEKLYLKGLLKVDSEDMHNHNSKELILNAEKLGYKTNTIIGKYLISACEDRRYDYYEAWIELI